MQEGGHNTEKDIGEEGTPAVKMLLHRFKKRLNRLLFGVGVGSGGGDGGRACASTGAGARVWWSKRWRLWASVPAGWC